MRWHGAARVERFLRELYHDAKAAAPSALLTYANFPPTEYLDLGCFDVCAFNVYLHREADLRAYLARLQHVAGTRPLLLAEAGADSIREGLDGQARLTAAQLAAAFAEGAAGAVARRQRTDGAKILIITYHTIGSSSTAGELCITQ